MDKNALWWILWHSIKVKFVLKKKKTQENFNYDKNYKESVINLKKKIEIWNINW